MLALLGPNGAGKTTAIGLLLGLLRADEGEVSLFGDDPQRVRAHAVREWHLRFPRFEAAPRRL